MEARFNTPLTPGQSLLFLDEIQAAPEVFAMLRYFREELPDLHVKAAGSLLEFVLEDHDFSMPVGRLEYLYLGPMVFEEFLLAVGHDRLRDWLVQCGPRDEIPSEMHAELFCWMRQTRGSNTEVDYVIGVGDQVVPVEVKAGKTGTLKSMHVFLMEKRSGFGLRFNTDLPSLLEAQTSVTAGTQVPFRLLSLPLYMVGQTHRLCEAVLRSTAG